MAKRKQNFLHKNKLVIIVVSIITIITIISIIDFETSEVKLGEEPGVMCVFRAPEEIDTEQGKMICGNYICGTTEDKVFPMSMCNIEQTAMQ